MLIVSGRWEWTTKVSVVSYQVSAVRHSDHPDLTTEC